MLRIARSNENPAVGSATAPIVAQITGGPGNQMFQWAMALVLARRTGRPARITLGKYLPIGYKLPEIGVTPERVAPGSKADVFTWKEDCPANLIGEISDYASNNPTRALVLRGYWQNPRLWQGWEDLIRNTFLLEPRNLDSDAGRTPVCVTVRRGDFVGHPLHDVCGADYYDRSLDYIRERVSRPLFIVVSDGIGWCRENIRGNDLLFYGSRGVATDFPLMLSCEAFIIANSTYAWWPAWLSQSPLVVTPYPWFKPRDSPIVPDDWVRLPARFTQA